ncbi:MAG TPA: PAS domain S-box protein, partial [Aggregatilineales bacterium]|nr:PAS domain S-box protein [Aggregatilineales bacterium]
EHKSRDAELRLLWHALSQSVISIIITNKDGNVEYVNPYFTQVTGYTLADVINKKSDIFEISYTSQNDENNLLETISLGKPWSGELNSRKKNGKRYWEYVNISPITDEDGNITHFMAIKENISELKAVEQQLRASERFAHSVVNSLSAHIAITDENGVILAVNNAWKTFAYENDVDPDKVSTGVNYFDVLMAVDVNSEDGKIAQAVLKGIQQVINGDIPTFSIEYPCHSPHMKRWFVVRITRLRGDETTRIVIAHENITERVLVETKLATYNTKLEQLVSSRTAQLERVNERMNTVLNNVSTPVLLVGADGRIDITNPAFNRKLGYQADELFRHKLWSIFEESSQAQLIELFNDIENATEPFEAQLIAKDGSSIDAEVSLSHLSGNDNSVVCTLYDISHLKEVERVKDAFISMVSHELRTPITSIMLSVSTINRFYDRLNDEQKRRKLAQMAEQAQTLSELVTSILDVARFATRESKRGETMIDVAQVLHDVVSESVDQATANDKHIHVEIINDATYVQGDHTDIMRIWSNLLSNAIKYTSDGGEITAKLYGGISEAQLSELGDFTDDLPQDVLDGGYIIGLVKDNGHGIRPEDIPQMFTRFFRGWATSTNILGTGLGLSFVRDLLHLYGGDIAFRSTLGVGTTFCFWLRINESSIVNTEELYHD